MGKLEGSTVKNGTYPLRSRITSMDQVSSTSHSSQATRYKAFTTQASCSDYGRGYIDDLLPHASLPCTAMQLLGTWSSFIIEDK